MLTVFAENHTALVLSVYPFSLFYLHIYNSCSPPGSPTTVGFFPAPSSLSSPAGLMRMPGLAYNGSGVKELINAVQGYQVGASTHQSHHDFFYWFVFPCFSVAFYSDLLLWWVCVVRYPLRLLEGIELVYPVYSPCFVTHTHTCTHCSLLQLELEELRCFIILSLDVREESQRWDTKT